MSSQILVAIRVRATPERAFEVFTSEVGLWWRPNRLFRFTHRSPGVLAFEPGVGGRFLEQWPDGANFEIGHITAWEPGVRLAFTWRQEAFAPGQMTNVEVRFEPVETETRVTVVHHGWETVPPEHVARHSFPDRVFLHRHGEWWQALLSAYKASLSHFGQS